MDANEFFERVENVNPKAKWNVTTTDLGVELSWEWDVTEDGFKFHDYLIPSEVMRDDELIKRHLEICSKEMNGK